MIRNALTIHPDEVQTGDTFVAVVTIHVTKKTQQGELLIRGYRSRWPDPDMVAGVPQGPQIDPILLGSIVEVVAPVLAWAGAKPDI
jgi:hypothetical protein